MKHIIWCPVENWFFCSSLIDIGRVHTDFQFRLTLFVLNDERAIDPEG